MSPPPSRLAQSHATVARPSSTFPPDSRSRPPPDSATTVPCPESRPPVACHHLAASCLRAAGLPRLHAASISSLRACYPRRTPLPLELHRTSPCLLPTSHAPTPDQVLMISHNSQTRIKEPAVMTYLIVTIIKVFGVR
jgi:hypothetical protein